jgi:hypothetical protein
MKKRIITAVLVLLVAGTTAFADSANARIDKKVIYAFNSRYTGATHVNWFQESNLYKATFQYHEICFTAYFDAEGEWVATTRNVLSDQLPLPLIMRLKNDFGDFWITELIEVDSPYNISFFVAIENSSKSIVLRSEGFGDWEVYRKSRKE